MRLKSNKQTSKYIKGSIMKKLNQHRNFTSYFCVIRFNIIFSSVPISLKCILPSVSQPLIQNTLSCWFSAGHNSRLKWLHSLRQLVIATAHRYIASAQTAQRTSLLCCCFIGRLPSSDCCVVACCPVISQQQLYMLQFFVRDFMSVGKISMNIQKILKKKQENMKIYKIVSVLVYNLQYKN
jgi:hypothetical protein